MKILITGCARSGTGYMTSIVSKCGIEPGVEDYYIDTYCGRIRSEKNDIVVSWKHAPMAQLFDMSIHVVRDPVMCISSCQTLHDDSWVHIKQYATDVSNESKIHNCMRYWLRWNEICEDGSSLRLRIEDIVNYMGVSHTTNTRAGHYDLLTLEKMQDINATLTDMICEKAVAYGYKEYE